MLQYTILQPPVMIAIQLNRTATTEVPGAKQGKNTYCYTKYTYTNMS